jgi:2-phosphosulfolactate phosphatase
MGLTCADADQHGFAYRFDWGREGLEALAGSCDVVVIVDTLRFTTAVSTAVDRGGIVFPYPWGDDAAVEYATERRAQLAGRREDGSISLSPTDLLRLDPGTRIVLPSPNGSNLSFRARDGRAHVLAGSLRNAGATARHARELGDTIAVIASGERWPDDSLRPCVDDLLGAGAVLAALDPSAAIGDPGCSPEAAAARAAFIAARPMLTETIADCASGRELARIGFGDDAATAAELDVSDVAAQLSNDAFVAV